MIIQKKIKDIMKQLAKEHGLTEDQVREIVFSPFGLLKKSMKGATKNEASTFKNIRIMNLGLFAVKPGRIKHLQKRNEGEGK